MICELSEPVQVVPTGRNGSSFTFKPGEVVEIITEKDGTTVLESWEMKTQYSPARKGKARGLFCAGSIKRRPLELRKGFPAGHVVWARLNGSRVILTDTATK